MNGTFVHNLPHESALPSGTALQAGAFELREMVGRGGTSFTYRGHDLRLGRDVAIKEFFPPGSQRNGLNVQALNEIDYVSARGAFIEEARALARFDHPHIVRVYQVFEENNSAYIVEEFLRGDTLQHQLDVFGHLAVDEAVRIMQPVCSAVEALHKAGLIHGDIKPGNIMRCDDGRIVLLDFGLSAAVPTGDYATTLLSPQRGVGTAGYAPLEQYSRHGALTPATDVYALAATLWHLLNGAAPPDAPGRAAGVPLPDIRQTVPRAGANVALALERGLAMNPHGRPQSALAWCEALTSTATAQPQQAPPVHHTSETHNTPEPAPSFVSNGTSNSGRPPRPSPPAPPPPNFEVAPQSIWVLVLFSGALFLLMVYLLLFS